MDRRVSGGLILVMALLVASVVPKVLNPARVDGVAGIAPPPAPPVVGDCIEEDVASYGITSTGNLMTSPPVTVVACDQPHLNEIVHIEDELAASDDPSNPTNAIDTLWSRCAEAAPIIKPGNPQAAGGWEQRFTLSITVVGPNRRQSDGGQRWAACVVGMSGRELTHPLAALQGIDIPPEFGECTLAVDADDQFAVSVPCTAPHSSESFAFLNIEPEAATTQADLDHSCLQLVADETRRPGLGDDSALVVDTEVTVWYDTDRPTTDTLPLPDDAAGGWATCSVRITGDRELVGSLRQLGDGPLPWAS